MLTATKSPIATALHARQARGSQATIVSTARPEHIHSTMVALASNSVRLASVDDTTSTQVAAFAGSVVQVAIQSPPGALLLTNAPCVQPVDTRSMLGTIYLARCVQRAKPPMLEALTIHTGTRYPTAASVSQEGGRLATAVSPARQAATRSTPDAPV
jgi:hypothetical protein